MNRICNIALMLFLLPLGTYAAGVLPHEVAVPYEIVPIETIVGQQFLVGTLEEFPEMFEFSIDTPTTLDLAVRYPLIAGGDDADTVTPAIGVIIVAVGERGVAEMGRIEATAANWEKVSDPLTRLPYLAGGSFSKELLPGTYRIEVSTPDNRGAYMVALGTGEALSFSEKFSLTKQLYAFYGVSAIGMIRTSIVLYPLGSIVLVVLIAGTWWVQRRR
jgi:hypothetical protein